MGRSERFTKQCYPVFSVTSLCKTKYIANSVSIALRAMLIASQLVNQFPALYEPRGFIAVLKKVPTAGLCPEPGKPNPSIHPHPIPSPLYLRSVLVLSFHVPVGFPSTPFLQVFPPNTRTHLSSLIHATYTVQCKINSIYLLE